MPNKGLKMAWVWYCARRVVSVGTFNQLKCHSKGGDLLHQTENSATDILLVPHQKSRTGEATRIAWRKQLHFPTSSQRGPFSKPNGYSANQEIPQILWSPRVHGHVHKSPSFVPILSQINSKRFLLRNLRLWTKPKINRVFIFVLSTPLCYFQVL
jgi:hypothetical protein